MRKRDELSNPNSCLNKTADDEFIFILRAQDFLAPETVEDWANKLEIYLKGKFSISKADVPIINNKIEEARKCAVEMRNCPTRKFPD